MSIQELCNLEYYRPDIKVFVICNDGYGLIQKTQDDFKNGHHATDRKHHVPLPDIVQVANAYKIPTFEISNNKEIDDVLTNILNVEGPVLCAVKIPISKRISLRVRGGDLDNMIGE
jgi:thiamine pyrophosphate enzyme, C-terminal TPP binding domain